ncbi:MAG TPA: hypothetical protein VF166_13725 [Gemmatimonadaceae bacterium]
MLRIVRLRGEMLSQRRGSPVIFDDKHSFVIRIASAEVGLDMQSLGVLMNEYVFAYPGAPLHDLRFATDSGKLVQRGYLHKVFDIPFTITAAMSMTPAGLIRIHPVAIKIGPIPGKGLLATLGIQLSDLLDLKKAKGVRVSGNDLLLDPVQILPPPVIEGRVTAVRVAQNEVIQIFDDSTARHETTQPLTPPDPAAPNYMYFRGGTLRFGKLSMVRADMQIIDLDPRGPFEFSLDQYNAQLVAGYSKNTPEHGLEVFMPDVDKVGRGSTGRGPARPGRRGRIGS